MEKAADICFKDSELTMYFIGLAILFELYSVVLRFCPKRNKEYLKKLKKKYKLAYSANLPENMGKIFEKVDFNSIEWKYFYNLSHKITY